MPKKINLIDERDKKIIIELDKNARDSDSQIAKKLKLSKQVVNYRIQKLVENKIINNFYTVVDISKFGLNFYYMFLQLKNINKEKEEKLIEKIKALDYVGWLVTGIGRWDMVIGINSYSTVDFEKNLNQIISFCGNHLHEYVFTTMISAEHLNYKFLETKNTVTDIEQGKKTEIEKITEIDKKILKTISQNARISIIELAEKTKIPLHQVNYHLKNLIKKRIIEGFKPKLNINLLNYQWYLLLMKFEAISEERKKEFIEFCKFHKNVYYVTKTIGPYNLMLDLHVKNPEEFRQVLLDIKEKFSDVVKIYESITIFQEHKIDYLPKNLI